MKKGLVLLLSKISDGNFHSGQELAKQLCITRSAVWKSIKQLESLGLSIEAVHGKGYRLLENIELLSAEKISNALTPHTKKLNPVIEVLFNIPSTNSYLLERIVNEELHAHVALAESQSDGRGRRGNSWLSPLGSGLCISLAWCFERAPDVLGLLSLYIGVAIVRALEELQINNVALKWPNDILIDNKKLGGVLIDMRGEAGGPVDVIIGVGINYNMPKTIAAEIGQPTTDICSSSTSESLSRNQLAASLLSHIFEILMKVNTDKTEGLIEEWRQHDCFVGKPAKLVSQQDVFKGIVEGVDDYGSLLFNVNGKIQRYSSGELSLRLSDEDSI